MIESLSKFCFESIYRGPYQIEENTYRSIAGMRKAVRVKAAFGCLANRVALKRRVTSNLISEG